MQAQCGALSPFQKHSPSFRECCVEEYASLCEGKASAPRYSLQVQTQASACLPIADDLKNVSRRFSRFSPGRMGVSASFLLDQID
jgi:hypothetical protein